MIPVYLKRLGVLASLVLVVAGCGSSAGGSDSESSAPTKAEFIVKADAICERTDQAQAAAEQAFLKKNPEADSSPRWQEKVVLVVGLPPIEVAAEELGDLTPPVGDEAKIQAIVSGMEGALKEAQADPSSMLKQGSPGPFANVFKLARDYGFKACATPI